MDAKSKAEFINQVASGAVVPCPNCDARNNPNDANCAVCGKALRAPQNEANVFKAEATQGGTQEAQAVFAKGLPAWDILPPEMFVRRRGI